MKGLPLYLAIKLSPGSNGRLSPAVIAAIAAVALSVATMLAAIAISFGFKKEIRSKVIGFNSHLTVSLNQNVVQDDDVVHVTPALINLISNESYVEAIGAELTIPSVLKTKDDFKGIYIKGVNGGVDTTFLRKSLIAGSLPDFDSHKKNDEILISRLAANKLGLRPGDKINSYFFLDQLKARKLTVKGIFDSHFESYDDVYAYTPLPNMADVAGVGDRSATAVKVRTYDFDKIETDAERLQSALDKGVRDGIISQALSIETVMRQGAGFFGWLQLLDMNVIVILVLMSIVATITLISAMLIVILDRRPAIGLLKALGASSRTIRQAFLLLSLRVAIPGMIIGNALMIPLIWIQSKYHLIPLDPETYYLDFVPVENVWLVYPILNAAVLIIAAFTLVLPSAAVAKIAPTQTMRALGD